MLSKEEKFKGKINGTGLIQLIILVFWMLFWLLNVLDKIIGGPHFLFVGKDRFAQIQRFFDSIHLGNPAITNIFLIIIAGLEIIALVFLSGSFYYFIRKNTEAARSFFFMGIVFTLIIFTFFSIGDQIFGDHFELLEHGLFWFIGLLSWILFTQTDKMRVFDNVSIGRKAIIYSAMLIFSLGSITVFSVFWHHRSSYSERTEAVSAVKVSENKYKVQFPFLAGSKAFENTIKKFMEDNPAEKIIFIYTTPAQLRLGESDGLIVYFQTEKK